ncbi:hypothetical protein DMENIID0001_111180 [Sergentomyia squamirostris]
MNKAVKEVEDFLYFLKFSVTSRIFTNFRGGPAVKNLFILLFILVTTYCILILVKLVETFSDKEIEFRNKMYMIVISQGVTLMLLKNLSSVPYVFNFDRLLKWIRKLHTVKDNNEMIQEIINENLAIVMKYSKIMFWVHLVLFIFSGITVTALFYMQNVVIIIIPYLKANDHPYIYVIIQGICCTGTGVWIVLTNTSNFDFGLYLIFFARIINKMIHCISDQDKREKCPDLLFRIIKKHLELINMFSDFNGTVKFLSLIQLIFTTILFIFILMCIQVYRDEYTMYLFFITVQLELFVLSVFGEYIRSETEQIFNNLYQTTWYDLSLKDQKAILFMMTISKKPLGLKAAGLYDISIMAFVQILKASITYSAIILTFTE